MSRVRIHTVDQGPHEITTFFLSCNRLSLLDCTIASYLATADLPARMAILDDSGQDVYSTLVSRYGDRCDIICFPHNRGQWWALDFITTYAGSKYIFYVEDDWRFLKNGYLSLSRSILEGDRFIGLVDISDIRFEQFDIYGKDQSAYINKKPFRISGNHLYWIGWVGSPSLRRREDLVKLGRIEALHAEWQIDRKWALLGLRGVYSRDAYVTHTGYGQSIMEKKRPDDSLTACHLCDLRTVCRLPRINYWFYEQELQRQQGWTSGGPDDTVE
jgi:hypothetical protein